jgi:hypothetical protein
MSSLLRAGDDPLSNPHWRCRSRRDGSSVDTVKTTEANLSSSRGPSFPRKRESSGHAEPAEQASWRRERLSTASRLTPPHRRVPRLDTRFRGYDRCRLHGGDIAAKDENGYIFILDFRAAERPASSSNPA